MRRDRTLDQVLDDLRQPAGVSELAGESEAVAAISNALRSASATPISAPRSARSLRVASFIAAGVIGFGSAAAAGPALIDTVIGGDEPQLAPPAATSEPTDQSAELTTVDGDHAVEDPDAPAADQVSDDPATAFDETSCADGNHGQTVNSIARATPSEPGKGEIVAEAAQSSCGKNHQSGSDQVVADEVGDEDVAKPDRKPGRQPDDKPDNKPDNQSDQKPDDRADQKPTTKKSTDD